MGLRHPVIWLLACGFLLAAPAAYAQSTELGTRITRSTNPANDRDANTLNKAECVRNDRFTFTVTATATDSLSNYQLEVWAGSGCADKGARITNPQCRLVFNDEPSTNSNTIVVEAQEIVSDDFGKNPAEASAEDCESTTSGKTDRTLYFLLVDGSDDVETSGSWAGYAMKFDMVAPDAPTGVSAGIGESSLVMSWSQPDDSDDLGGYRFYCDPPPGGPDGEGGATGSAGASGTSGTSGTPTDGCSSSSLVPGEAPPEGYDCGDTSDTATNGEATDLENGQTYAVAVASVDDYGNVGVLSEVACGTPEPVTGFFEAYREAGGQAGGGFCAMRAGKSRLSAGLVGLALLGLLLRRRREPRVPRRARAKAIALLTLGASLLTLSGTARAQGVDEFGAYGGLEDRGERRSPQEAAFEIRVGPYRPHVDDAVAGSPYKDIFGGSQRWHAGFEVDWQVLRIERTLSFGPGFSLAYTRAGAKAPLASGTGRRSAQDTELEMLPMFLAGVLRIDALADRTPIPLAPYAKLGFGYALWWASDGENSARAEGVAGKGASYGYTYSLGVLLRLDPFDPADAASADASLGINHSGLFIEWFGSSLDGFGSADVMEVGTSTWVAGLAIEM